MIKFIPVFHGPDYFEKHELKQVKTKKGCKDVENYMNAATTALGNWNGEGSTHLGFGNASVNDGEIAKLSLGYHPKSREQIFKPRKPRKNKDTTKKKKETPPWIFMDGTASAVKDYSIFAFLDVGNEQKYIDGQIRANQRALDKIAPMLYTRRNGKKEYGLKPIIASFTHKLSRPTFKDGSIIRPDMQIHTHNLICKYAVAQDGTIVAIDNYPMLNYQKVFGTIYRAELANVCREMGLSIVKRKDYIEDSEEVNEKGGKRKPYLNSFGIKGVTDEMRAMFSKRKNDIDYIAKVQGFEGNSIAKGFIAQNQKRAKVIYSESDLIKIWTEDAKSVGLDKKLIDSLKTFDKFNMLDNSIIEERLLTRIQNKGFVYEKNALLVLAEYEQYTGIKTEHMFDNWIKNGSLKEVSRNKFICTVDLTQNNKLDTKWKNRITVNKISALKALKTSVKLSSFRLKDFIMGDISTKSSINDSVKSDSVFSIDKKKDQPSSSPLV